MPDLTGQVYDLDFIEANGWCQALVTDGSSDVPVVTSEQRMQSLLETSILLQKSVTISYTDTEPRRLTRVKLNISAALGKELQTVRDRLDRIEARLSDTGTLQTAAARDGWWLKICSQLSTADFVKFDIGVGGNDDSHRHWLDWSAGGKPSVDEYDSPPDLRQANELWWGVEPYNGKIVCSLMWQGHCVQTARCESREEYEKHQDDSDGTDC
jgi:hypothetical protein